MYLATNACKYLVKEELLSKCFHWCLLRTWKKHIRNTGVKREKKALKSIIKNIQTKKKTKKKLNQMYGVSLNNSQDIIQYNIMTSLFFKNVFIFVNYFCKISLVAKSNWFEFSVFLFILILFILKAKYSPFHKTFFFYVINISNNRIFVFRYLLK